MLAGLAQLAAMRARGEGAQTSAAGWPVVVVGLLLYIVRLEFLSVWEEMYNPGFNSLEFDGLKSEAGVNRFAISVNQWIAKTSIVGHLGLVCAALVRAHPGQRAQLADARDTRPRTMERCLKQLRKAGRLEFVGSPKTGGYHANAP